MEDKKKTLLIVLVLVLLLLIAGLGYSILKPRYANDTLTKPSAGAASSENASSQQLQPAPSFTVYDAKGNAVTLDSLKGKPIVLNFWASWCGPCKSEMPDFEKVYAEYKDKVHFAMVNMTDGQRETQEKAQAHIDKEGFTFPVYFDLDLDAAKTYGVSAIPATYVIDADGNLVAYANGTISSEALIGALDNILK
ncbi:TlpA family protein disulfide reductase [Pygmaiobacter massiliensis]|uniref:TlpA family protein disulfide reductase n=1 Tax=Pygmaiobacter massiliensis TaxID=1917873 RepID=UPI000C7D9348|nr:TlpA disulfide reductase family protein [Pygmaiobacter massiliensis]